MLALASWLDDFSGAAGAPWFWWGLALLVIVGLLFLGLKLLGLLPE